MLRRNLRRRCRADGAAGERIVPHDNIIRANDKAARSPADLGGTGATPAPVAEDRYIGIEGSELMKVG
jgi:hypothetical protein